MESEGIVLEFKFISCESEQGNVTLEYIKELEGKLEISFPDVLIDFYTNHNKAELLEPTFTIEDLEFTIEFIIPLCNGRVCVEKILSFNSGNEYIPKTFIPLAEDIMGSDFYWDSSNSKVYYLYMGNVENPIPICDTVEQFFELLNKSCE